MEKRGKGWKVLLTVLLLLAAGALLFGAYTGLMPGLSGVVGADKPRDLGVRTTQADYNRAVESVTTLLKTAPASAKSGPVKIDHEFTEAELTALLAHGGSGTLPLREPQVRIHADGLLEISLGLAKSALPPDVLQRLPRALPEVVPLYVKATLAIAGTNELRLDAQRVEVGRIPLPTSILDPGSALSLSDMMNQQLQRHRGLVIENLIYQEGRLRVQGTYKP